MSSKKSVFQKELKNNCIGLKKFLALYCGVSVTAMQDVNMSHDIVKKLMPDLKRISFDFLEHNKRMLYTGEVIVVEDSFGNIAPYKVPENLEIFKPSIYNSEQIIEKEKEKKFEELIINENLSRYELVELCRFYKQQNRLVEYRIVNRLLKVKKDYDNVKKYKKAKDNLIMEGRKQDDKY